MCIAILKTKYGKIPQQRLQESYNANPDGFGVMRIHSEEISVFKGCVNWQSINALAGVANYLPSDIVYHFRTASSGKISDEKCHPFYVNEDLAFVQNGNLFEYSSGHNADKTDIQRFNEQVLQKLPDGFLDVPEIRKALEDYCRNNWSKMIFMDSTGRVEIICEDLGEWVGGCWYSNGGIKNYIGYGYSGAYYYNPGDVRHKGGLFSVQMLPEGRRKHWSMCECCGGYFRDLAGVCEGCLIYKNLLRFIQ